MRHKPKKICEKGKTLATISIKIYNLKKKKKGKSMHINPHFPYSIFGPGYICVITVSVLLDMYQF